ncbi:tRNA glutamyl-Q(34) synthetase GluQRS [Rhizobium sp. SL42]|uniref:tRNA glutamyl-Q(34) synthetase GluQRS n=1 Tax=Rhizobium sp. SL42 TaxID=2806346 RepID=UPI001F00026B|nr:tRNA glutamyl-Q(34) synthetase GluQRS [Rhizobium sp. SL42]UJW75126.1 tRNA glutamyl-Q(34) synthetase GluQRS [Rhizobium sp. SL42]
MIPIICQEPILRFAPSPNGRLHLGHALSAMTNADMAKAMHGRLLLRMEDIDVLRCTPDFERSILEDLHWLAIDWQQPVRRQSEHFAFYRAALDELIARELVYPAFLTRGEVKAKVAAVEDRGEIWRRDPDGAPLYPTEERHLDPSTRQQRIAAADRYAWRLNMDKALAEIRSAQAGALCWSETGDGEKGQIVADPAAWGDVVLWRSDAPSSYHLSVTLDDAAQGITHVVRGLDLYHATSVHRLLQALLGLPAPTYHHHRLLLGPDGRKLSKSNGDTALSTLREGGAISADIRRLVGL